MSQRHDQVKRATARFALLAEMHTLGVEMKRKQFQRQGITDPRALRDAMLDWLGRVPSSRDILPGVIEARPIRPSLRP
ncbi:MAG: hypothetical protein AAGK09_10865 [Planctomycetota bacterium]